MGTDSVRLKLEDLPQRLRSAPWVTMLCCACAGFLLAQSYHPFGQDHFQNVGSPDGSPDANSGAPRSSLTSTRRLRQSLHAGKASHKLEWIGSDTVQQSVDVDVDAIPEWDGPPRSELEAALRKVAPAKAGGRKEVLIAVCTFNLVENGMLDMFLNTLLKSGVQKYLIVAIDTESYDHVNAKGLNVYHHEVPDVKNITGKAWDVSARKFGIIQHFLELGWDVLLTDIDVVLLKDPFLHLHKDHDVEAMSDGYDEGTLYGRQRDFMDTSMGWASRAQGIERMNLNSGFFYLRANRRTAQLMARMAARMAERPGAWDQAEFNDMLFTLSHQDFINPACTVRVMEPEVFMNSKVLFKYYRHLPAQLILGERRPAALHMNYHPDKQQRMQAAIMFFMYGNQTALAELPGGSEPGTRHRQ